MTGFEGVSKMRRTIHAVDVATPFLTSSEVAARNEIRDNALRRPLGNADGHRNITGTHRLISRNANEHVRVICQERPLGGLISTFGHMVNSTKNFSGVGQ